APLSPPRQPSQPASIEAGPTILAPGPEAQPARRGQPLAEGVSAPPSEPPARHQGATPLSPPPSPQPPAPLQPPPQEVEARANDPPEAPEWDRSVRVIGEASQVPVPPSAAQPEPPALVERVERSVTVSIGRLEVKVVPPPPGAKPTREAPAPGSGLSDYLRRRSGGGR